jgi:2-methylisocitrate lyase-like PEP mutase family enzyme
MTAQKLMAGYSVYTSAQEVAASAGGPDVEITPTTTITTSSAACISAASAISAVSIDNTFDHGC